MVEFVVNESSEVALGSLLVPLRRVTLSLGVAEHTEVCNRQQWRVQRRKPKALC